MGAAFLIADEDFRIHQFNDSFLYDVSDIERQKVELQPKQTMIEEDLKAAAAIQRSLLPEGCHSIPNLKVAWRFNPCERIGGDIFNIQRVDEDQVGLYMLDVCGHAVPAALISVAAFLFLAGPRGLLGGGCQLAVLDYRGPVIGFGLDTPYGQKELHLEAGDKIII